MNIAYRWKLSGLTQAQLASKLGISASLLSKWCTRVQNPRKMFLPILADCFGITVEELLSDPEDIDLKGLKPEKSHESCENNQTSDHRARIEEALVKKVEQLIPAIYDLETAETVKAIMETIIIMRNDGWK